MQTFLLSLPINYQWKISTIFIFYYPLQLHYRRCLTTFWIVILHLSSQLATRLGLEQPALAVLRLQLSYCDKQSCSRVTLSNNGSKELLFTITARIVMCYMKQNVCGNIDVVLAKSYLSIVEMSTSSSSQLNILSSVYT